MTGTGPSGLRRVIRKSIFVSQILGCFPYWLNDKDQLQISWFMIAHNLIVLAAVLLGFANTSIQCKQRHNCYFEWVINLFKITAMYVTSAGTIFAMLFCGRKLNTWLVTFCKAVEVTSVHMKVKFSYRSWDSVLNFFVLILIYVLEIIIYDISLFGYLKKTWGSCFLDFLMVALINQFIGILETMRQLFLEMNGRFHGITLIQLEAWVIAYERLASAAQVINEAYGIQLLLLSTGHFLSSTFNAFLIVNETVPLRRMLYILKFFKGNLRSFRLIHTCVALVKQSKKFNILLERALVEENKYQLSDSPRLRLHLAMKKKIQFTAYGFFVIDYGLINAMLGALTTYLVVLMQFDKESEI